MGRIHSSNLEKGARCIMMYLLIIFVIRFNLN